MSLPILDSVETADRPGAEADTAWRQTVKGRAVVVLGLLGVWAVLVAGRLVQLQVFQHDEMVDAAASRQQRTVRPAAKRGDIVDRHGITLAYSVDADAIMAATDHIDDPAATVHALCQALGDCTRVERADLLERLSRKVGYPTLRGPRDVSPEQAARVAALKLPGIHFLADTRRYYPKRDLASHLIGYVGTDNVGLAGVEHVFDEAIRGRQGRLVVQKDARRKGIMWTRVEQAPTAGATVELTIDLGLQHIAERELRAGVEASRARGGTVVVMNPQTGEILALANYPTFNPNAFSQTDADDRRNRAIQEIYEPGSTFKIVTASAAIEEGVIAPSDLIDCGPGHLTIGSRVIRDASGHNYGVLSFADVIVKSSNVGAVRAGWRVGADRLGRYMRRFGFGERLSPDFKGETGGIVWNSADLDESALASVSMGYQVGVTPLQMVTAVSAVANGGLLLEPHLRRAVIRGDRREEVAPKVLRRAISAETAATLTSIMEDVVVRGTAKAAALEHYQVAGKTGTAKKLVDGRYSDSDYNASFIGFVPSRRPELAMIVVIDTPRGAYYGGTVAAPVFKRIAEAALRQMKSAPTVNPAPPLIVTDAAAAGSDPQAVRTTAVLPTVSYAGGRPLMPDVRGLAARDAIRVLGGAGLTVRLNGTGFVAAQTPLPGEPVEAGARSVLQLRRERLDRGEPGGERR